MGYSTYYEGQIEIDPPLNQDEINYLKKFHDTRRMHRKKGPYFVDGSGFMGQDHDSDVIDFNTPDPSQPGLWCKWEVTEDGKFLEWDGAEKFYDDSRWMEYLIEHFLKEGAHAKEALPFLQCNHVLNGKIFSQGEEVDDTVIISVDNNIVSANQGLVVPVGAPSLLTESTILNASLYIDREMAVSTHLKVTGCTKEQIEKIKESGELDITVPEHFVKQFGLNFFGMSIEIKNDEIIIFFNDEHPIIEAIYLTFEHLFNKSSDIYNSELDMHNVIVDGTIEIKNTYYRSTVTDDLAVIVVANNKLFIHQGKMIEQTTKG